MTRQTLVRIFLLATILGVAVVLSIAFDLPAVFRSLLTWISGQGIRGALIFALLYVIATVFFIPGSVLTLGAGFVFGVVGGTVIVSIASTIGAFAAFMLGRYVARGWVSQKVSGNRQFGAIDEAVGREGWKIVLLTRLSPVFPFNLLNYSYGLTAIPGAAYVLASWIGMLPGTVMYVYLGSLTAGIATLGTVDPQRGPLQWTLYGVGFVATIAVTIFVTRLAQQALRNALAGPTPET